MTYDGGKNGNGVIHAIGRQMPPHRVRAEVFGGSFPTLRLIKLAPDLNVGIDADARACDLATSNPALRACSIVRTGAESWLRSVFPVQLVIPGISTPKVALTPARIEGRTFNPRDVLVYCDPPYLLSTRSCQRDLYNVEMKTEEEHAALLDVLTGLPCLVMLSGYRSALYDERLRSWRRVEFTAYDRQHRARTECLWCNFPEPTALHDTRFAGRDFRERWALTKQKRRWVARLAKMSPLKRQALAEALAEC